MKNQNKLKAVNDKIDEIINKAKAMELANHDRIGLVHPVYRESAINLVHYLAFRSFEIDTLQTQLKYMGLPSLTNIEGHVMYSLFAIKSVINSLLGLQKIEKQKGTISIKKSEKQLKKNTKLLFGNKSKKRRTRIMVTLPSSAADDYSMVNALIGLGMNSARINCAHDDAAVWSRMIDNIKRANTSQQKNCKIMMDLGGPKLRTGAIKPGPKVIHIKPQRDQLGVATVAAKIWIAPPDVNPPDNTADAVIPVDEQYMRKIKKGDVLLFTDSRAKKCQIQIEKKQGNGKWGSCNDSAYLSTGTELILSKAVEKENAKEFVGELLPIEQHIVLFVGDQLLLHSDQQAGEPAKYNEEGKLTDIAHLSCTLPEIFKDVKKGESIFFDDGMIEGKIQEASENELLIKITNARNTGSKLRADKGINLPETKISLSGLTEKDKNDLQFVAQNADVVNFSFVNDEKDVQKLLDELKNYEKSVGIILKIETQKGFKNLPTILLKGMQTYPIGVMIARGDLAIETGWKNFASIQEEILRICEAAHIPDVWATQVLENLAKKGVPTRSEITDAAMAQRAECVMLNKGMYIDKAVKMLDKILRRMQKFQDKKEIMLPKLTNPEILTISHDRYNV
ncbi:MAG: pyruvate kinase [Bacteroidota bacterium]